MGGTLLGPEHFRATGKSAVSFQMSPDFTGCPFYPDDSTVTYKRVSNMACCLPKQQELVVGGGLVETFAFNGEAPSGTEQSSGMVDVGAPCLSMSLCQAAGISSDSPASELQLLPGLGDLLTPKVTYWPVTSEQVPTAQAAARFDAGDGGVLENAGLLALLQRGAKKAIWVANSYRGLNSDYDLAAATAENFDPDKAGVIEQLYDKFGYGYQNKEYYYSNNQVFEKEALLPLVQQIVALKKDGQPAVIRASFEVLPNTWWGIKGGNTVEIFLIYLERVADFEDLLPLDTQKELAKGDDGRFPGYPTYKTSLADLRPCQVNLLAAQAEFCVRSNKAELIEFCS